MQIHTARLSSHLPPRSVFALFLRNAPCRRWSCCWLAAFINRKIYLFHRRSFLKGNCFSPFENAKDDFFFLFFSSRNVHGFLSCQILLGRKRAANRIEILCMWMWRWRTHARALTQRVEREEAISEYKDIKFYSRRLHVVRTANKISVHFEKKIRR